MAIWNICPRNTCIHLNLMQFIGIRACINGANWIKFCTRIWFHLLSLTKLLCFYLCIYFVFGTNKANFIVNTMTSSSVMKKKIFFLLLQMSCLATSRMINGNDSFFSLKIKFIRFFLAFDQICIYLSFGSTQSYFEPVE